MDQRERNVDFEEALRTAMEGFAASRLWTALPAIVVDYDPETVTATVQPAINMYIRSAVGTFQWTTMVPIKFVPVQFPAGGGMIMSYGLVPGDEVLLVFCSRCIDNWQQLGGVQNQAEFRTHDLTDAVAIPGIFSKPRTPIAGAAAVGAMRIGKDDGSTYVEVNVAGQVTIVAPAGVAIAGNVVVDGEVTAGNIPLTTHLHGSASDPTVPFTGVPLP